MTSEHSFHTLVCLHICKILFHTLLKTTLSLILKVHIEVDFKKPQTSANSLELLITHNTNDD